MLLEGNLELVRLWRDENREAKVGLMGEASPVNLLAVEADGERLRRVLAEAEVRCRVLLP